MCAIRPRRVALLLWIAIALGGGLAFAAENKGVQIAVLISRDGAAYTEALAGFQKSLAQRGVAATYDIRPLGGDEQNAQKAATQAVRDGARLILALGSLATRAAISENAEVPVVAGLVPGSDNIQRAANATGVVLELPLETQFEWLQRLLPEHKTVGILFNPKENQARVDAAVKAARSRGLKLIVRPVENPQDLPDALEAIMRQVDILLGIADPLVLSSLTAKPILLSSYRNRIPLVGLSSAWVKAGALYSLDWDYSDIGAQCAELAHRVLTGTRPAALPPNTPRKLTYSLNLKAAGHMAVTFPDSVIRGANQVYE